MFGEAPEREYRVEINAEGFRGKPMDDVDVDVDQGGRRVFVVGDSHMFGPGVDQEELFAYRLEHYLSKKGEPVHVYNFPRNGTTLPEYARSLVRYRSLQPDLVVIVVYAGNDLAEFAGFVASGREIGSYAHGEIDEPISARIKVPLRRLLTYHIAAAGLRLFRLQRESGLDPRRAGPYLQMMGQAAFFADEPERLDEATRAFASALTFIREDVVPDVDVVAVLLPTRSRVDSARRVDT